MDVEINGKLDPGQTRREQEWGAGADAWKEDGGALAEKMRSFFIRLSSSRLYPRTAGPETRTGNRGRRRPQRPSLSPPDKPKFAAIDSACSPVPVGESIWGYRQRDKA